MVEATRLKVILAFTAALICGIPIWWFTTRVPRAVLPHNEINHLVSSQPFAVPFRIELEVVRVGLNCDWEQSQLQLFVDQKLKEFRHSNSTHKTKLITKVKDIESNELKSLFADAKNKYDIDDALFRFNNRKSKRNENSHKYQIYILPKSIIQNKIDLENPTWGSFRHAFFSISNDCQKEQCENQIWSTLHGFITPFVKSTSNAAERKTPTKSVTEYQLTFTLLSSEPSSVLVNWNISNALKKHFYTSLNQLQRVAKFNIDSQIKHFAPLTNIPDNYDESSNEYLISSDSIQRFVNPNSWHLESVDANATALHFVVFVPPADKRLRLIDNNNIKSNTNAFVVPQWGGVLIFNVPNAKNSLPVSLSLDEQALKPVMNVFVEQLKLLLGVPSINDRNVDAPDILTSSNHIPLWQIDYLVRSHLYENLITTTTTLQSLSSLVESLTTMKVLDHIKTLLEFSLSSLNESYRLVSLGEFDEALKSSGAAMLAAETAFFDRDMLAMLYYPDEHNLAIYLSFFLPISLPFLSSWWNEFKRWRNKNKSKNEKSQSNESMDNDNDDEKKEK